MRFVDTIRLVWLNIVENKGKALLTSLGIIVGSATIIMVIAIGKGGEAAVKKQFENLSAATIYINPNYSNEIKADYDDYPRLTEENVDYLLDECSALFDMSLNMNGYKKVIMGGEETDVSIQGSTSNYHTVSNLPIEYGESFTETDLDDNSRVAVIGSGLAKKYFSSADNAVGNIIVINNRKYTIIGVLERKGDGIQGQNPDETIYIPYTTGQRYVFEKGTIPRAIGLADDVKSVKDAITQLLSALDYIVDNANLLSITDAGSRIEAATESSRTMSALLLSVSVIVFIVGGIGIMNVLLVSVKERTKEIGILKALGSSQKEILIQFLLEATGISLFGGIVGAALSVVIMPLMKYTDLPVVPSVSGVVLAIFFALITGTLFGFYPAYQASKLNPIQALSYE